MQRIFDEVKRNCPAFGPFAAVLAAASLTSAMTIVTPADPGQLALDSDAVLLLRAGTSRVEQRGTQLYTRTEFEVVDRVSGFPRVGDLIEVEVPGGELAGSGFAVAGTPSFERDQVYLVFADLGSRGTWRPRLMADSVMRRDVDLEGHAILIPVEESAGIGRLALDGGPADAALLPVYETSFLAHLRDVLSGAADWTPAAVRVPVDLLPVTAKAVPTGCTFLDSDGRNIRWRKFDFGSSQVMYAEDTADASISGVATPSSRPRLQPGTPFPARA